MSQSTGCQESVAAGQMPDAGRDRTGPDDAGLVARAQAGDYGAFEELVKRYRNDVFGLSYHFVRNPEDAWDLSQEVFVKAYKALKRFRQEASFKTWLLRITANQSKDYLKKRRLATVPYDDRLGPHKEAGPAARPDRHAEMQELGRSIEQALDTLPHKHRTVIVLREYEGLSYEEMASVIGCSIGTVMSRLHHARRKLRNQLIRMGVVEEEAHEN